MSNLTFNIGKTSFNTTLLVDITDNTDLVFGDIYVVDTEILIEEFFDLYIEVINVGTTTKNVKLFIYSDDSDYVGWTSEVPISSISDHTFIYNDKFENLTGYQTIRMEVYVDEINYISASFVVFIYGNFRILTNGDIRQLTDLDTRVMTV